MIEPIGTSLLCSCTSLIFGYISLTLSGTSLSGTSLSQSGAHRQLALPRSPDP
jgi:hypothetical protein